MSDKYKYIFTEAEMDSLIEEYAVPVWEARDEHEQALAGYVLACILDYIVRNKEREQSESLRELEGLRQWVNAVYGE